ncbi:hypothetical protein RSOLAG1IB_05191 [Rhizoctonia solani AG-1 IB]|uniref:Secreted protein n=1 Tax=Thanatephorus cucumeris (strain AG1-IB / isolate 7/3/14) TaxID=1108050 RepID=A0A0B7FYZ6_THACB|nr:hypothetical protein RSOLAG1IB_05191 [Rhizoctonia solani AG-1 IB]
MLSRCTPSHVLSLTLLRVSSLGGAAPVAPWVGVPPSQLPQPTRLPVLVVFLSLHLPYPPAAGIRPSRRSGRSVPSAMDYCLYARADINQDPVKDACDGIQHRARWSWPASVCATPLESDWDGVDVSRIVS